MNRILARTNKKTEEKMTFHVSPGEAFGTKLGTGERLLSYGYVDPEP